MRDLVALRVLPPELYAELMARAGGSVVRARMLLEAAIEQAMHATWKAMRDDELAEASRRRAEMSRYGRRFGWRW